MTPEQRHASACPELEPIEVVVERIRPRLDEMIARFRIPPQDAEDILQNTFLLFLQKRSLIRNDEGWLICVARRQCLNFLRNRREKFHSSLEEAFDLPAPQQPEGLRHDLRRALARIPQRCRSVIQLRYKLGFGASEVAEKLGYRPSSVRKIASRCVAALGHQILFSRGSKAPTE